ncbi:hypothetical protein, partial [Bradyrhizobium sp.]|uniref:hypothetical protein n=1 Tax=Bradyrhizobium sp. TaxID=376 RepID=UPI0025BFF57E
MSNTPDSPAEKPDHRMDQGGNFWALFTPGIWKGLHAVLHRKHSPRSARPRIFDGAAEAKLIALACSKPPK